MKAEEIMWPLKQNEESLYEANWDAKFRKLYQDKGLMIGDKCLPMHEVCERCAACWSGSDSLPDEVETAQIARPWVGKSYARGRLLGIGINLNLGGGFRQLIREVTEARQEIRAGKKKLFRKQGYGGTLLYYYLGYYAAALLCRMGIIEASSGRDELTKEHVASAFDYLAFTEHVKCSPKDQERRARPNAAMWEKCGGHILRHEIELLSPKLVLIIGKTDNWTNTCKLFSCVYDNRQPDHIVWTRTDNNQLLIGVRHPMAWGGPKGEEVRGQLEQIELE